MSDQVVHERNLNDDKLYALISSAFADAYPDLPEWRVEHMARNFCQVVGGAIDFGNRVGQDAAGKPTHMDLVNSIVFWCIANTHLEDYFEKPGSPSGHGAPIPAGETQQLMREFCARVGGWLAGLEALKAEPELYDAFIMGSVALGVTDWERNRGELGF